MESELFADVMMAPNVVGETGGDHIYNAAH